MLNISPIRNLTITANKLLNQESKREEIPSIRLSYKPKTKPSLLPKINGSGEAYKALLNNWNTSTLEFVEQFKVMLLNRANKVIGILKLSTGGTSATIAEPKLIFATSIIGNATGIILANNHPSGNLTPSQADIDLTRKLKEAGRFLEIPVLIRKRSKSSSLVRPWEKR